jgi:iron complex transport system substrate-binding protein
LEVNGPPRRIVSVAPNVTEILFALGLGDRIVGVTRYCDYPAQALEKEKIGGMVDPNLERIQALRPDLIVAFRGNPLGVLGKLRNLHFPVFVLNLGSSLDGLFQTIEKIGRVTRADEAAGSLVANLREKHRAIRQALGDSAKKPKVFLSVYGQGLWTCGEGSYLNDLLIQAGGLNIAGKTGRRWLQLNREQLIHENPEVIIIMAKDQKRFSQAAESFRADRRLKDVRAVRDNQIHLLDENAAGRFGPRLLDALEAVARILHPEAFEARK